MKLTPVLFERVFDIHLRTGRQGTRTEFGFEAHKKKIYGVTVFGHHEVPVGQPLMVAMSRRAGWKVVYGWKNLSTGQVTVQPGRNNFVWFIVIGIAYTALTTPLWVLNYPLASPTERTVTGLLLLTGLAGLASMIHREWLQMKAKQLLEKVADAA